MINTGGGRFDPTAQNIYFIASSMDTLEKGKGLHENILIAVNEMKGGGDIDRVKAYADSGAAVFLDSGIFNLTNEHMRRHGCTMDEALALAPDEIDGFEQLWYRYLSLVEQLEPWLWGYIELDQGGAVNKRVTRDKLNRLGLKPVPVYHPLNDGWEYFDELARTHDRICFGNIVQASQAVRLRLVATAFERRLQYPGLWIHLLGYTVNETLYSCPSSSCDSSTWLAGVRWSRAHCCKASGMRFSLMPEEWTYRYDAEVDELDSRVRAVASMAYDSHFLQENWREYLREVKALELGWS